MQVVADAADHVPAAQAAYATHPSRSAKTAFNGITRQNEVERQKTPQQPAREGEAASHYVPVQGVEAPTVEDHVPATQAADTTHPSRSVNTAPQSRRGRKGETTHEAETTRSEQHVPVQVVDALAADHFPATQTTHHTHHAHVKTAFAEPQSCRGVQEKRDATHPSRSAKTTPQSRREEERGANRRGSLTRHGDNQSQAHLGSSAV